MSSWTVIRNSVSVNVLVVEILLSVCACWMKSWPCSRIKGPRPRFGTGRWMVMCWLFLTSKSNLEACHMKLCRAHRARNCIERVPREISLQKRG